MMHDPTRHPDDERLSALASGDADVSDDRALRDHVDACQRCSAIVDDLFNLRAALAQLPDLAPSRPLRLIPPVPEPARAGGFARRFFAPALVAGLVLVVAGGVGTYARGLGASAGGAYVDLQGGGSTTRDAAQPVPAAEGSKGVVEGGQAAGSRSLSETQPFEIPWPAVLVTGLVLLAAALILRFSVQPRAG